MQSQLLRVLPHEVLALAFSDICPSQILENSQPRLS